jgi:pimeloyl-ACP methyl ester carboxylesterase
MTKPGPKPGWQHRTITIDGRPVFVRVSTTPSGATPVVHVHGFGISGSYLMPTAELLTDDAVQIVPDLPGYGRSAKPTKPLTIPQLAGALRSVLDELEVEKAFLLGNSMGSPIIGELAVESPDRVAGIIMVAPAGGLHNRPFARAVGQLALDGVRENPAMARVAVPDYVRFGPINALRLFSDLTKFPARETLLSIPVPTLAVLGSRDPLMPRREEVLAIGRQLPPHVTIAIITGAAHAVNFSHPGELAHVIRSWLDGVEIVDDPDEPGLTSVMVIPRD